MRIRCSLLALLAALGTGFVAVRHAALADNPPAAKAEAKDDILAGKKVHLKLKAVSVIDAVDELARQSGYSIQIQGDAANLVKRTVTLDTGATTFWPAFDQLCRKADLVEIAAAPQTRPGVPNLRDRPGLIRPLPLPINPRLPKGGAGGIIGGLERLLPADGQMPGGVLPFQLPDGPLPDIDVEGLEKMQGEMQQQLQQLLQIAKAQLQLVGPQKQKPGQPKNPFGELQQLQQQMHKVLDQMIQVRPGAGGIVLGGGGRGPAGAEPEVRQINVKDGKVVEVPTAYAGAARIRLVPQRRQGNEAHYVLDVALEPSILTFTPGEGSEIDRVTAAGGEELKANVALSRAPAAQTVVQVNLGEKEARSLKEVRGHVSGQVLAPGEPLIVVGDVWNAGRKAIKGEKGGTIEVLSIEKKGDAEILLKVRLETPAAFNDGLRSTGLPMLADAKGVPYQLAQVPSRGTRRTGAQTISQDLTMVFRPNPGQGDATQLVLNSLRPVTVRLPFRVENVPLP